MKIAIKKLTKTAIIPQYAHPGDSGFDLHSDDCEFVTLYPRRRRLIKTGLSIAVPDGLELQIRSRSGLANKNGVFVLNSPGTVDAGYRGEIGVILFNAGDETVVIKKGDRIAQGVIAPVIHAELIEVDDLDETNRGIGGFGSTGV